MSSVADSLILTINCVLLPGYMRCVNHVAGKSNPFVNDEVTVYDGVIQDSPRHGRCKLHFLMGLQVVKIDIGLSLPAVDDGISGGIAPADPGICPDNAAFMYGGSELRKATVRYLGFPPAFKVINKYVRLKIF